MASSAFLAVGVIFDIDRLADASYGSKAWRIFMAHVDPLRIAGCMLKHGDTAATLKGNAREFCVAAYGADLDVGYVRRLFEEADEEALAPLSSRFADASRLAHEPLVLKGEIDRLGRLVTDEWDRGTHDLCKEAAWGYQPRVVPPHLPRDLVQELEQMKRGSRSDRVPATVGAPQHEFPAEVVISEYEADLPPPSWARQASAHEDLSTARARGTARDLRRQHGQLTKVVCERHPKSIALTFEDGTTTRNLLDKGFFMQFGYTGTGPSCFWAFLDESGFKVPYWYLCESFFSYPEPFVISRDADLKPPPTPVRVRIKATGAAPEDMRGALLALVPPVAEAVEWQGPKQATVAAVGTTSDDALSRARSRVPKGAEVEGERIVDDVAVGSVEVEALSETAARRIVSLPPDASVAAVETVKRAREGFLGHLKRKGSFRVLYEVPAKAEVTYRVRGPMSVEYSIPLLKRFRFRCGEAVSTTTELLRHCREHRDEAKYHLSERDFEGWLCPKWAAVSQAVRRDERDDDSRLDRFLEAVEATIREFQENRKPQGS